MSNSDPKVSYLDPSVGMSGPMFWLDPEDLQNALPPQSRAPSYHRNQPPQPYQHQHPPPPPAQGSYVPNGRSLPPRHIPSLPSHGIGGIPQSYGLAHPQPPAPLMGSGTRGSAQGQYHSPHGASPSPRLLPPPGTAPPRSPQNSVCPHCGKTYSRPDYLTTHIAGKHSGRKMWTCRVCGKSYKWRSSLSHHQKTAHQEQAPSKENGSSHGAKR